MIKKIRFVLVICLVGFLSLMVGNKIKNSKKAAFHYVAAPLEKGAFETLRHKIHTHFVENGLRLCNADPQLVNEILTKENLIQLLEEAIGDDARLELMLKDSQMHPLGFQKIMLMNDWEAQDWELRLHIWWPREHLKPVWKLQEVAEARHIHLFSFVSRILTGVVEDFRYQVTPLTSAEIAIYKKFEKELETVSQEERLSLYSSFDAQELMKDAKSSLFTAVGGRGHLAKQQHKEALLLASFTAEEKEKLQFFYSKVFPIAFDEAGKQDAIERIYYKMLPQPSQRYSAGDVYFFPAEHAHRLYVDPASLTSTFFIAGKFEPGVSSGAFSRTQFEADDGNLPENSRVKLEKEQLRESLIKYLEHIRGN